MPKPGRGRSSEWYKVRAAGLKQLGLVNYDLRALSTRDKKQWLPA